MILQMLCLFLLCSKLSSSDFKTSARHCKAPTDYFLLKKTVILATNESKDLIQPRSPNEFIGCHFVSPRVIGSDVQRSHLPWRLCLWERGNQCCHKEIDVCTVSNVKTFLVHYKSVNCGSGHDVITNVIIETNKWIWVHVAHTLKYILNALTHVLSTWVARPRHSLSLVCKNLPSKHSRADEWHWVCRLHWNTLYEILWGFSEKLWRCFTVKWKLWPAGDTG